MEQYSVLAKYYDALMDDVDYRKWAEFYDVILKESGACKRVVDMGCGTGSITVCLASLGYDMTAIDISSEMLAMAQSKADKAGVHIRFSEQDMSSLDVGGGYGGVICSFDGVNYLLSTEKLKACFDRAYEALDDGGVFVFDVSTPYKYKNILSENAFVYELDGLFLSWQSFYNEKRGICDYYLTFFSEKNGVWHRFDEEQRQRSYSLKTIEKLLRDSGFTIEKICADTDFSPVESTSERCHFICRKGN